MQAVDLRRNEFLFLSALLDGRPRTIEEIAAFAGWKLCQPHVAKFVRQHSRYGWIERGRFHQATRCRSAYRITPSGKRAWKEEADWWLHNVAKATKKKGGRLEPKRDFKIVPLRIEQRRSDRPPTAEEAERLLSRAPREFALLCRALWLRVFTFRELAALRVEDVSLAAGTVHVPLNGRRRRMPLAPELKPIVKAAIGDRETGLVFHNQLGRAWQSQRVSLVFAHLRRAGGLPREIALRGRTRMGERH
jgi:DNA-binding MarR family transcriptional regulator